MIKVKIVESFVEDAFDIYIYEKMPDGSIRAASPAKLVMCPLEDGAEAEPTFHFQSMYGKPLLEAFAEALNDEGIKRDKDAKIEGTLEATRCHLEDLRAMLNLK